MKHGYGERWGDFSLTVDKVGEDAEGNHLVEVSAHDRMDEINVRMYVSKEYYGSMIPWVAARMVLVDLTSWDLERVRVVESGRWSTTGVRPENPKVYLAALNDARSVASTAAQLPEDLLRAHRIYVREGGSAGSSIHNAHKMIFDRGLPDAVEFITAPDGQPIIMARWQEQPGTSSESLFKGLDWNTAVGQHALSDFLGMLNLRKPFDLSDIRPRRLPRSHGPKEWSPYEIQSFMLVKGRDYGRPAE